LFGFSDFRLEAVYVEQTSGAVEHRGASLIGAAGQKVPAGAYNDWGIRNIRFSGGERLPVIVDGFRFGARVMYPANSEKPDVPRFSSEWYGLSIANVRVADGEPTLVGTLGLENNSEALFVFLTIRRVE
jgi:hypothetical protein